MKNTLRSWMELACLGCKAFLHSDTWCLFNAAMTMTKTSSCVEYKAIQGVHKDYSPLIRRDEK